MIPVIAVWLATMGAGLLGPYEQPATQAGWDKVKQVARDGGPTGVHVGPGPNPFRQSYRANISLASNPVLKDGDYILVAFAGSANGVGIVPYTERGFANPVPAGLIQSPPPVWMPGVTFGGCASGRCPNLR